MSIGANRAAISAMRSKAAGARNRIGLADNISYNSLIS